MPRVTGTEIPAQRPQTGLLKRVQEILAVGRLRSEEDLVRLVEEVVARR